MSFPFRISFFGCWNVGCLQESDQKKIANRIKFENPNLLLIAGDNTYYKDKKGKDAPDIIHQKRIKEIMDGIECFNGFEGYKTHIILGNHDMIQTIRKCDVYHHEKLSALLKNWNLYYGFGKYTIPLGGDHRESYSINLIFVNTNFYVDALEMTCYDGETEQERNQNRNILRENQNIFIENNIIRTSNCINIIIGHHPAVYLGRKKDKVKDDGEIIKGNFMEVQVTGDGELLKLLVEQSKNLPNKLYYLCADEHLYQTFEYANVYQIISGTGGASIDEFNLREPKTVYFNLGDPFEKIQEPPITINPNIIEIKAGIPICKHGYCNLNLSFSLRDNKPIFNHTFNSILPETQGGKSLSANHKFKINY